MSKISGPFLDRIDIHIEVSALEYKDLSAKTGGEPSNLIRERVERAREVQWHRFKDANNYFNASMSIHQNALGLNF